MKVTTKRAAPETPQTTSLAMLTKLFLLLVLALNGAACVSQAEQTISDANLTATVKTRLAAQATINAIKINVDTLQGNVSLSGTVPSVGEKTQAEQIARETPGVKAVTNKLEVNPDAIGSSTVKEKAEEATRDVSREASEALGDAGTLARIKARFVADGILGVDVDVNNGEVTLTGTVANEIQKAQAEALVRKTKGVTNVKNNLTIKAVKP